jgi:hypothetical protein
MDQHNHDLNFSIPTLFRFDNLTHHAMKALETSGHHTDIRDLQKTGEGFHWLLRHPGVKVLVYLDPADPYLMALGKSLPSTAAVLASHSSYALSMKVCLSQCWYHKTTFEWSGLQSGSSHLKLRSRDCAQYWQYIVSDLRLLPRGCCSSTPMPTPSSSS